MSKSGVKSVKINRVFQESMEATDDLLVVEEPLQILLRHGDENNRQEQNLSITMRTPGQDFELVLGFLLTEGIIASPNQIKQIWHCTSVRPEEQGNTVKVELQADVPLDSSVFSRNFYMSSSCGICGKTSIEAVVQHCSPLAAPINLPNHQVLMKLPEKLKEHQLAFRFTGGIHAAALFNFSGEIELVREDVGRHNAMDKLVGASFKLIPAERLTKGVLLSGRLSFELIQKIAMAGFPLVCCIGAPSSLAIEFAQKQGIRVIGFLKAEKFNWYC